MLDAYLALDPNSRVACETMIKNNMVFIAGKRRFKKARIFTKNYWKWIDSKKFCSEVLAKHKTKNVF